MGTLVNPAYTLAPSFGYAGQVRCIDSGDIAVAVGDIDASDLIKVFRARKGQVVIGALMESTDLDTDGSPAIVLALGDAVDDDRFITGATVGQAGGATSALAAAGYFHEFTEDTDIFVKVTTAADAAAAGTIRAALLVYERKV